METIHFRDSFRDSILVVYLHCSDGFADSDTYRFMETIHFRDSFRDSILVVYLPVAMDLPIAIQTDSWRPSISETASETAF
jgi:hypothetical protein